MDFSLNGKVALITGASRGIGESAAIGLAKYGADVILASRKLPDLEKVAQEVRALGKKALPIAAHVAKMDEIKNLVAKAMETFGRIDILVNNAATNPTMAQALTVDERAWDAIMNLNLKGLFFLSQAVAQVMKEKGEEKSSMFRRLPGSARIFCRFTPSARPGSSWPPRLWPSSGPSTASASTPLPLD